MRTDIENSFTAKLKYNLSPDPSDTSTLINTDFWYTTRVAQDRVSLERAPTFKIEKREDLYLCINTQATKAVTLYFRYETISTSKAGYRIWVRGGGQEGNLLASSNPGTIYANYNYGRPHFFRLVQRDADNHWTPITINEYSHSKLLLQVEKSKDTYSNVGKGSNHATDFIETGSWYAYLETGNVDDHWYLDDIVTNVDYIPSDVWRAGKA